MKLARIDVEISGVPCLERTLFISPIDARRIEGQPWEVLVVDPGGRDLLVGEEAGHVRLRDLPVPLQSLEVINGLLQTKVEFSSGAGWFGSLHSGSGLNLAG